MVSGITQWTRQTDIILASLNKNSTWYKNERSFCGLDEKSPMEQKLLFVMATRKMQNLPFLYVYGKM